MSDMIISPLVETWRIANLTTVDFGLPDVPGLTAPNALPKMVNGVPQWFDALEHTSSELLGSSTNFRNGISSGVIGADGYKHTHEGSYDIISEGGSLPNATTWHFHDGMDVLTGGASSNADALHTHSGFSTQSDIDSSISIAIGDIDLGIYVKKAGSISQLSDIASDGATIETAVGLAHAQDHTLLDHVDDVDPFTIAEFRKLFDGSNADCLHVHSGGGGTFDGEHNDLDGLNEGEYVHLTTAQIVNFTTLTDGSNADALHTHVGGGTFDGVHNDLDGLQGGSFLDPSNEEYYHLSYAEYIGLIGGDVADDYHIHTSYNILLGINCDPSTSRWNDGLFPWDEDTRVACALDDVNEVLGSLAPAPAPNLENVNVGTGGLTSDLSFGPGQTISGYTNASGIGSVSPTSLAVTYDESFANSGTRVGVINDTTDITGVLNSNVSADTGSPTPSYPAFSFGDGDQGELKLEVNGVVVRTVDLSTAGTVDDASTVSGFYNLTAATSNSFPNGDPFTQFKYRTGSYRVDYSDMNNGWNYARVTHIVGSAISLTNYIDWVIDDDETDTTYATVNGLHNLIMTGSEYLSGVRYHTDGTADYDVVISNAFRNTYKTGNIITFNCSNGAITAQSLGDCVGVEELDRTITDASFEVSSGRKLDATISASTLVARTFNSNEDNDPGASSSIVGLLMDDQIAGDSGQTDIAESFNAEGYRQESEAGTFSLTDTASYASGSGNGPAPWDSTESLVGADAGHNNGLLEYNGALRYPTQGVNSGDFRNTGDEGPGCEEGYSGNPNYSGASGDRVYLRYFYVGTGKQNFTFTVAGSGTFVTVATGVSGQNITLEMLLPNTTQDVDMPSTSGNIEFKDCVSEYFSEGQIGCRSSAIETAVMGTSSWVCTAGGRATSTSGNVIVIRVTASSAWTGNISQISVSA